MALEHAFAPEDAMNAIVDTPPEGGGHEIAADERIVSALVERGRLKDADLARARRLQEETGGSLLGLLARLGLVS
jgi:general secretion pathway protein E